jgi:anti-sigma factor RsiW
MKERVFLLRDGELPPEGRGGVEAHLGGCAECRDLLARWDRFGAGAARAVALEADESFVQSVMSRLGPAPARGFWAAWKLPALAALSPVLAALLFSVMSSAPEAAPSTEALLLSQARPGSAWAFSTEAPGTDDLMGTVLEEDQ